MKKKTKITGMFWHCHHNVLCEYVHDYQERVDYIKKDKPEDEVETRLKLFKKVKGKLPKEFVEIAKKYDETREKYHKAWDKYDKAGNDKAWDKYDKARDKYYEAMQKYLKAKDKYRPQIEKLHKKKCGCSEWDGREIVL